MQKLISLLTLSVLVVAACGGASGVVAATVDGLEITVGDVEALVYVEDSTISKETFAQFLAAEIGRLIMISAVASEYDVEVDQAEIAAEADRIFQENKVDGQTREAFVNAVGATDLTLINFAQQNLIREEVLAQIASEFPRPPQAEIDEELLAAQWRLTLVCASHILVETEEEAQAALDAVAGGEAFADVAIERSTGPSGPNGGDLGCTTPIDYVPEFRDATLAAPVGEVYERIVQTFFGFHVIFVSDRTDPLPEDLPTEAEVIELLNRNAATAVFEPWFLEAVANAGVVIDERYGTWQPSPQPQVIPPSG